MRSVGEFVLEVGVEVGLTGIIFHGSEVGVLLLAKHGYEQGDVVLIVEAIGRFGPPLPLIDLYILAVNIGTAFILFRIEIGLTTYAFFVQYPQSDSTAPSPIFFIAIFPFIGEQVSGELRHIKKVVLIAVDLFCRLYGMKSGQVAPFTFLKGVIGVDVFFLKIIHVGIQQ